jgi:uncharacterized protein YuzE
MAKILIKEEKQMRIEYDPERDLLYIYFAEAATKASQTVTITPGVFADFDKRGKLIGIEVLEASEMMGKKIEFKLPELTAAGA